MKHATLNIHKQVFKRFNKYGIFFLDFHLTIKKKKNIRETDFYVNKHSESIVYQALPFPIPTHLINFKKNVLLYPKIR